MYPSCSLMVDPARQAAQGDIAIISTLYPRRITSVDRLDPRPHPFAGQASRRQLDRKEVADPFVDASRHIQDYTQVIRPTASIPSRTAPVRPTRCIGTYLQAGFSTPPRQPSGPESFYSKKKAIRTIHCPSLREVGAGAPRRASTSSQPVRRK